MLTVAVLWFLRDLVLILLTAIVIASAIEPAVHALMRRKVSRLLSVILVYLLVASVFFGIIFFFVPPVLDDAAAFFAQLPTTLSELDFGAVTGGLLPDDIAATLSVADILREVSTSLGGSTGGAIATLSAFFGGIASFVLIVVFFFFFFFQETGVGGFFFGVFAGSF